MAVANGASVVAWGSSTIFALLVMYLSAAGVLLVFSEEKADDSVPSLDDSRQAGRILVDSPDKSPSEKYYFASSVHPPAKHIPHLHRKLNSFRNLQISPKLPQSTTPLPQGPSPTSNRVHLQELSADNSVNSRKEQNFQKLPQSTTPPPQGPSPISNRVHLQELPAVISVNRFRKEPNSQELPQSSTPPPQGPSLISNRVHPQGLSVDSSVSSHRKELNFQKLPQDTTPPPQGPSPVSNRVHLQELPADSPINNYRSRQNFQKLPQTTTAPPEGSLISKRFHLQELLDDNLESQKPSVLTRGHRTLTWNHVKVFQGFSNDKSRQDQSNLPSSSIMLHDQKKKIIESNVLIRARRYLRSMNFNVEAVSRELTQDTQSRPQGPPPTQNGVHFQEIASPSNSNAFVKPSPLPSLLTNPSSDSLQREEKKGGSGRLVFQMLPQDTALAPSGPSPIHN